MIRELRVVTAPDYLVINVGAVRDDHLRAANGSIEDQYIERLIKSATRQAERQTRRSLQPQTLELSLTLFPVSSIWLPRPPVIEIVSVEYVDADGATQTLASDAYELRKTGRDLNQEGLLEPAYNTTWPSTRYHLGAVTVTYRAGYEDTSVSPAEPDVPEDIIHGVELVVGEFYKQRSESVHTMNQNPAIIRARDLWNRYAIY